MTSWHVEGVGDIHTTTTPFLALVDVAGYFTATPAEVRRLAVALYEAAAHAEAEANG